MDPEDYNQAHEKALKVVLVFIDMTWLWVFLFDTDNSPKFIFSEWIDQ